MERTAFVLRIKPDKVDEYVKAHAEVWPEMRQAISDAGIRNYTIYLHGNEAIGYYEAEDMAAAWEKLARSEVNNRWQSAMAELLEERVPDGGPPPLQPIFRLD